MIKLGEFLTLEAAQQSQKDYLKDWGMATIIKKEENYIVGQPESYSDHEGKL